LPKEENYNKEYKMNSAEMAQDLINRAKSLKEFVIERELPENFEFYGAVPFDMYIKDGMGKFKVVALNENEAAIEVDNYLKNGTML
jgi:hypothetical protein